MIGAAVREMRRPNTRVLRRLLGRTCSEVVREIAVRDGRVLLVGGSVRDMALGCLPKDLDWEVYGFSTEDLIDLLARHSDVSQVGVSFGVVKARLDGHEVDISLPRRERKQGKGHKGFVVEADPGMTPREAASRRDFTWNAMAVDLHRGEFLDFFDGLGDLRNGLIRHVGPSFAEDPLRVLRAMQFAARFGLRLADETALLCAELVDEYRHLPVERVWMEWAKWAESGKTPGLGLEVLRTSMWNTHYPELSMSIGCLQDPRYHPEGDVWTHTMLVCDAAASIAERDGFTGDDRLVLMFAALCHDLGKPSTTVVHADGRITSAGHAEAGEVPTLTFLRRIGAPDRLHGRVVSLLREHMTPLSLAAGGFSLRGIRRLARRLDAAGNDIVLLAALVEADHNGRPPLAGGMPAEMLRCVEEAKRLGVLRQGPGPILFGRHLIALGVSPGPHMGRILSLAMEAQLDGEFQDLQGAMAWARRHLETLPRP
jgi:tRNA nucleotidyltransferase (CCA-adding enzyme)